MKKRENMAIEEFFKHKSQSKRWFRNTIHCLISRDQCCYFAWQSVLMTFESRSYLLASENVIVPD